MTKSKTKMICLSGSAAEKLELLRAKFGVSYSSTIMILLVSYDDTHRITQAASSSGVNRFSAANVNDLLEK